MKAKFAGAMLDFGVNPRIAFTSIHPNLVSHRQTLQQYNLILRLVEVETTEGTLTDLGMSCKIEGSVILGTKIDIGSSELRRLWTSRKALQWHYDRFKHSAFV
jgi:hypothetical protein